MVRVTCGGWWLGRRREARGGVLRVTCVVRWLKEFAASILDLAAQSLIETETEDNYSFVSTERWKQCRVLNPLFCAGMHWHI